MSPPLDLQRDDPGPTATGGGGAGGGGRLDARRRVRALLSLAWPVILTRAGILTMVLADIIMVGRYDSDELAYAALGNALFVVALVTGIGLSMGVLTLTSQAFGAGDKRECGRVFRRGVAWSAVVGVAGGALVAGGAFWLALIGHEPELAAEGGAFALAVSVGAPFAILHVVASFHLEATRRPTPGLVAMAAANVLNIGLNGLLIYGLWGAPELGAVGSAIATAVVRTALFAALLAYILTRPDRGDYGLDRWRCDDPGAAAGFRGARFWGPGGWAAGARMRVLGFSAGVGLLCETSAYFALTQFAGFLGKQPLGAFAIVHNVEAVVFMGALGIASATAVLVGNAIGAGSRAEAAASGWTGLGAVIVGTAGAALLLWSLPRTIAAAYTPEAALISAAAALMPLAAMLAVLDGAQIVMSQACRATGDAWAVTRRAMIAFWGVMIPLSWILGVRLEWGAPGLLVGAMAGCAVNLGLQCARFHALTKPSRAQDGLGRAQGAGMGRASSLQEQLEYFGMSTVWVLLRPLSPQRRWDLAGWAGRAIGSRLWFAKRAETGLRETAPELSAEARRAAIRQLSENFSRLLIEYESLPAMYALAPNWRVSGLEHLEAARAKGDGRVVIAGAHYGNWEAVRAVAALHGAPLGLVYRPFNNPRTDQFFRTLITSTGLPVFPKGKSGTRALFKHVATGGGAMILVDQRTGGAPALDFMGRPAETSLAAAQLAARTRAPLLTARARRTPDGFEVRFEPEVPAGDPAEMMQLVNDRIGAWVREDPGQWFWLHRRWRLRDGVVRPAPRPGGAQTGSPASARS